MDKVIAFNSPNKTTCLTSEGLVFVLENNTWIQVPLPVINKGSTKRKQSETVNICDKYSDEFEKFWVLYPKAYGKQRAYEAWKKKCKSNDFVPKVMAGLDIWNNSSQWCKDGGKFVTDCAKWLREGYYLETPEVNTYCMPVVEDEDSNLRHKFLSELEE